MQTQLNMHQLSPYSGGNIYRCTVTEIFREPTSQLLEQVERQKRWLQQDQGNCAAQHRETPGDHTATRDSQPINNDSISYSKFIQSAVVKSYAYQLLQSKSVHTETYHILHIIYPSIIKLYFALFK